MSKIKHIFAITIALAFLFSILIILDEAEKKVQNQSENNKKSHQNTLKITTVIDISPTTTYALIQSFGEVKPHWRTTLKARKQGEVLTISDHLQEGKKVKKGEVLFTFNNRHYQTLLAESHHQIAQAELLLHSEKQQAKLAKSDWKLTRRKGNPSGFYLRIPQIKAAQTQLTLAKTRLNEIRQQGGYSKIAAPYNGIITSRSIGLGEVVEAGQTLAEMISSDRLDIKLRLDDKQWGLLDKKWYGQKVDVFAANSDEKPHEKKWSAIIERDGGMVDSKTRLRSLHLKISSRYKPLSGSFVRVEIRGKRLSNLLKIPVSALTSDGKVWWVDADNKLQHFQAKALFSKEQNVFINTPKLSTQTDKVTRFSIVVFPLSSYLPEHEVIPKKLSTIKVTEP